MHRKSQAVKVKGCWAIGQVVVESAPRSISETEKQLNRQRRAMSEPEPMCSLPWAQAFYQMALDLRKQSAHHNLQRSLRGYNMQPRPMTMTHKDLHRRLNTQNSRHNSIQAFLSYKAIVLPSLMKVDLNVRVRQSANCELKGH